MNLCMVNQCLFIAEFSIEDFLVCSLHDHDATRGILEQLQRPLALLTQRGFPIVVPCGPLEESHLVPRPAFAGAIRAGDSDKFDDVPNGPADAAPAYDLTR